MTRKEIVQKLFDRCMPCIMSLTADQENRIIRDLEVLEILKKIKWDVYENGGGDNWNWFVDNKQSMKITDKDAQLLKEWLEDDR